MTNLAPQLPIMTNLAPQLGPLLGVAHGFDLFASLSIAREGSPLISGCLGLSLGALNSAARPVMRKTQQVGDVAWRGRFMPGNPDLDAWCCGL